ncbi:hypothetical protein [Rhizobium grahamii]|uniref:hypothetical protein n=1 Tax=Rhizobium grahamii TaxID=1120045 RepID=UPI001676246B|nr:hypothetical protein [Rhizobium grahamii]
MATAAYGIVVITDVSGEIVDPEQVAEHHPAATEEHGEDAPAMRQALHNRCAR